MRIKPLFDRVIIQEVTEKTASENGFIVSQAQPNSVVKAKVLEIGNGNEKENGNRTEMQVKVGDRILCNRYAITTYKHDSTEYGIIRQTDILAILN